MEHVPAYVEDQVLKDCWARAGAQLVDAFRFSHGDTRYDLRASSLDVGLLATVEHHGPEAEVHGGQPCWAVETIRKEGICDSRLLEEEMTFLPDPDACQSLNESFRPVFLVMSSTAETFLESTQARCEPRIPIPNLPKSCGGFDYPTEYHYPNVVAAAKVSSALGWKQFQGRKNALATVVQSRLTAPNAQPLGINFCDNVLRKGKGYRGLRPQLPDGYAKHCDIHTALLIGQKWDQANKRCMLKVRNSWGRDCDLYSKNGVECDGKGNVWVDRDALLFNTSYISGLK